MNQRQPVRRRRRHPQVKTSSRRVQGGRKQNKQNLIEKMGFRPGRTLCLINPPQGAYVRFSKELPKGKPLYLGLPPRGLAHIFVFWPDGVESLENALSYLKSMMDPEGAIWVVIPRKKAARDDGASVALSDVKEVVGKVGLVNDKQVSFSGSQYAVRLGFGNPNRKRRPRR